jgi:hypothetical protein
MNTNIVSAKPTSRDLKDGSLHTVPFSGSNAARALTDGPKVRNTELICGASLNYGRRTFADPLVSLS